MILRPHNNHFWFVVRVHRPLSQRVGFWLIQVWNFLSLTLHLLCLSFLFTKLQIIIIIIIISMGKDITLAKGNLSLSSGPMVRHNCPGMTISTPLVLIINSYE